MTGIFTQKSHAALCALATSTVAHQGVLSSTHLVRSELSQAQIAKLFGVTQPRVSDLLRGKINLFGLDALVNMASAAGLRVELKVRKAA